MTVSGFDISVQVHVQATSWLYFLGVFGYPGMHQFTEGDFKFCSLSNEKEVRVQAGSFLLYRNSTEIVQVEERWSQVVEHLMKESVITWTLRVKQELL